MSSISSLTRAITGLRAQQVGLETTAHNMGNVNTKGYVRQNVLFGDSNYLTIGRNANGSMQVGLGVDIHSIRQVRNQFLDLAYRNETSRKGYYSAQCDAVEEVEAVFGELRGESFSDVLNNLWNSMSELAKNPESLETRGAFVQNAYLFAERSNNIMKQLENYQKDINVKVINTVDRINEIGDQINELNQIISQKESSGTQNANDYRDTRNVLLDELSSYVDINVVEDSKSFVSVKIEGIDFVTNSNINHMGTTQATEMSSFVDPYWPSLTSDKSNPYKVFNFDETINAKNNNDKGELKGLLMTRGLKTANYTDLNNNVDSEGVYNTTDGTNNYLNKDDNINAQQKDYEKNVKPYFIENIQAQFDNLVHTITTSINNIVSSKISESDSKDNGPYGLDESSGFELFTRKNIDRYGASGDYNKEITGIYYNTDVNNDGINERAGVDTATLYSATNIEINKDILNNYDKICISKNKGEIGDQSIMEDMLKKWKEESISLSPDSPVKHDISRYYNAMVEDFSSVGSGSKISFKNQEMLTLQIENQRQMLIGVSTDEELNNMMIFQHAYNANAKIINVIDGMLDKVINQTGLVGR